MEDQTQASEIEGSDRIRVQRDPNVLTPKGRSF